MKITKIEIRQIINEELSRILNELDFGKVLFGSERGLPTKVKPEKDTPEEQKLFSDLKGHYNGRPEGLDKWINTLDQLEQSGKYTDILTVPSKYKYAYRVMSNISLETLTKMLGYEPTSYEAGEIYEEQRNVNYIIDKRYHYSWTINPNVLEAIRKDWGSFSFSFKKGDFLLVVRAPISKNRFILNPDRTKFASEYYDYQKEILSIRNIKCDHIWYMPLKTKNIEPRYGYRYDGRDYDEDIVKHIRDYEKSRQKERK